MYRFIFFLIVQILFSTLIIAQPSSPAYTISLSLPDAENLFLQKNFSLLASKYEISAADAAIVQAKLYPNPNFYIEQGAYNPETKKTFELGSKGETSLSLQQVVLLAGKRSRQI